MHHTGAMGNRMKLLHSGQEMQEPALGQSKKASWIQADGYFQSSSVQERHWHKHCASRDPRQLLGAQD